MNPLATKFTPSTSPEPKVSQHEPPVPWLPSADEYIVGRLAGPTPVYDFGQQSAGPIFSVHHFHPQIGYYHAFTTATRGNTSLLADAPSQDGFATQRSQHESFEGYHGTPSTHPLARAIQSFAERKQNLETNHGPPHPLTEAAEMDMDVMWPRLPLPKPAPGAKQTVSSGSRVAECQTIGDNTPKPPEKAVYQLQSHVKLSGSSPCGRSDIESPALPKRVTAGRQYVGQYEDRATQTASQPSRGREPAALNTKQMLGIVVQSDSQSSSSVCGSLGTPHQTSFLQAPGQLRPLSRGRGEQERYARRSSRPGTTRRQSSHRGVGLLEERQPSSIETITGSLRSRAGSRDNQDSLSGCPSLRIQRRDEPLIAWPQLTPTVTALQMSSPRQTPSSVMRSTSAQIMPAHTPNGMLSCAPIQTTSFNPAATTSFLANQRVNLREDVPSKGHGRGPEYVKQEDISRNKLLDFSEQGQVHGWADPEFASIDTPQQRDDRGDAAAQLYTITLSRPSDTPRNQKQPLAVSQQLKDTSPYTSGSRAAFPDIKSVKELPKASSQPSRTPAPTESGAWSQSKRWMSEEAKERMSFARMINNLRHIGADKSPAIPRSLTELAAFKAAVADAKKWELKRIVSQRLKELERRKYLTEEELNLADVKVEKLFWGRRLNDQFSPVLACRSCFNNVPDDSELQVNWPCMAELKEEGEYRGARYRRYFPIPRLNIIDSRVLVTGQEDVYNADGTIRWQMKAVKHDTTLLLPISLS